MRLFSHLVEALEADDPAAALADFMTWAIGRFIEDRCLCEAAGGQHFSRPRMQELFGEVTAVIEPQKIDVLFSDRVRRLIHSQPPA